MDTIEYDLMYLNRYREKKTTFVIFLKILMIQQEKFMFFLMCPI